MFVKKTCWMHFAPICNDTVGFASLWDRVWAGRKSNYLRFVFLLSWSTWLKEFLQPGRWTYVGMTIFKNWELRWDLASSARVAFWQPGSIRATTNCHLVMWLFLKTIFCNLQELGIEVRFTSRLGRAFYLRCLPIFDFQFLTKNVLNALCTNL